MLVKDLNLRDVGKKIRLIKWVEGDISYTTLKCNITEYMPNKRMLNETDVLRIKEINKTKNVKIRVVGQWLHFRLSEECEIEFVEQFTGNFVKDPVKPKKKRGWLDVI